MPEIKNNSILDILINYAKTQEGEKNATFTAERFLVAICDFIDGNLSCENDDPACKETLRQMLAGAGADTKQLKVELLAYIKSGTESFLQGLYIQKKAYEARSIALKQNAAEITPELLLKCVLDEPTEVIRKCICGEARTKNTSPDQTAEDAQEQPNYDKPFASRKTGEQAEEPRQEEPRQEEPRQDKPEQTKEPKVDTAVAKKTVAELTKRVKNIRKELLSSVFGQENAVNVFTNGYFQAELSALTDPKRSRPRATFLFAGPPGVGKTFLAEKAAQILGLPFIRFDMSEYSSFDAVGEFCGQDSVFRNSNRGKFTGFVDDNPKCVVLFDEIEKAHTSIIHLFLQILDAGRIRDNNTEKELSLTNVIMIFTTNAGKQLYEQSDSGDFSTVSSKVILKALQQDARADTGLPFFPPAICSRFSSGNVVMFNHIEAHNLRRIAKKEMLRQAENLQKKIGISVEIDEPVYSAILYAEGGTADARIINSRAEAFINKELLELFRLVETDESTQSIQSIEKVRISVRLPEDNAEIASLFTAEDATNIMVFSSEEIVDICRRSVPECHIFSTQELKAASEILHGKDIQVAFIDMSFGIRETADKYLNAEDIQSAARDFLRYIRENFRGVPVYLLQNPGKELNAEERTSFLRLGVRGVIERSDDNAALGEELRTICSNIHQQSKMNYLARANRVITYETAQSISPEKKTAEITLFDFAMKTAIDAGDSKNILSNVSKPNVRFDQVIGAEDAKKELRYFVQYLRNPKKYLGTGVRPPKGVILYGPPGTGKTMLAKAMACESDVTFISAQGNQFLQKYVGEGEKMVRELFMTARRYAPTILFIDEIDAIAKERKGGDNAAANGESILTTFLAEMDGFKNDATKPVFVLAATNFDVEPGHNKSLDPALMRRFDRRVYIDLPNKEERTRFINMKLQSNQAFCVTENEIGNIAVRSTGMSLAALESVMELALRSAVREGNCKVTDSILEEAFETFNSGEAKKWDGTELERVARHEAGHAYLCWQSGETPSYITIVARGNHGGYMQHDDNEGKSIYTREDLLARIRTSLGGRAAEIVCYGEKDGISTGASGDLAAATSVAQQIICQYGMDEKFGLAVIDTQNAGMGELSSAVRIAVNQILDEQMQKAVALLTEGRAAFDALVSELMSKNHLSGTEIDALFRANCT